ncbi:hypothetical protein F5Y16DRAFT_419398 [Xylariaceae sp. FL0255]|nr:hypothetical protein F5Y16DRAFT_419398 [Xylariaceae sp. FL0255]
MFQRLFSSWIPHASNTSSQEDLVVMNKPGNLGAPKPVNNLSGKKSSTRPPHPLDDTGRSNKRQRTQNTSDEAIGHTLATFAFDDTPSCTSASRKRPRGSSSLSDSYSHIAVSSKRELEVPQFKNLEARINPPRKRQRHRPSVSQKDGSADAPEQSPTRDRPKATVDIDEDIEDDEVQLVQSHAAPEVSPQKNLKHSRHHPQPMNVVDGRHRFSIKKMARHPFVDFKEAIEKIEKERVEPSSSADELGHGPEDIQRKRPVSHNISKAGDIKPTLFKNQSASTVQTKRKDKMHVEEIRNSIIGDGLRIVQGFSGGCKYQKSEEQPLVLSLSEMPQILHPLDEHGEILKHFSYLTINMGLVTGIQIPQNQECRIVVMNQTGQALYSSGPKLVLEFESGNDIDKLMRWYKAMNPNIEPRPCPVSKLEQDLDEMLKRAIRTRAVRDADQAADLSVIEHNRNSRLRDNGNNESYRSNRFTNASLQLKVKDSIKYNDDPKYKQSHRISDSMPHDDEMTGRYLARPARRKTRQLVEAENLSDMEDSIPLRPGWSVANPGWHKNWRNSIVYPTVGTHRATVDKEDISRLDEGEFLNDNIIIFYLRYLQQQLQDKQPELARRIHFHNTFFYEKLKPTKGQGINYDSVKSWTSKVDLFSKDYIIVPICEYSHWYVAIICNAPKLMPSPPSPPEPGVAREEAATVPDGTKAGEESQPSKQISGTGDKMIMDSIESTTQTKITEDLMRMSIDGPDHSSNETKQVLDNTINVDGDRVIDQTDDRTREVHVIEDTEKNEREPERGEPLTSSPSRKKKRQSVGLRKYDPSQPRIITLDSLGSSHSPTCKFLSQYLIAELKDKKGIEIGPFTFGMTAKDVPQQSNHCDCGLYLLGYIQEFLEQPDLFIRRLLQRESISWKLNPSTLRNEIRDLIFDLQKQQQRSEDEKKLSKKRKILYSRISESPPRHEVPPQNMADTISLKVDNRIHPKAAQIDSPSPPGNPQASSKKPSTSPRPAVDLTTSSSIDGICSDKSPYFGDNQEGNNYRVSYKSKPSKQSETGGEDSRSRKEGQPLASPPRIKHSGHDRSNPLIPGSYPKSPENTKSPLRWRQQRSSSRDTANGAAIQADLLGQISDTSSSNMSHQGTSQHPLNVEDVENSRVKVRHTPQRQQVTKNGICVELQSNSHRSVQNDRVETKAGSDSFPDRKRGETICSARVRQPEKPEVIDLSS